MEKKLFVIIALSALIAPSCTVKNDGHITVDERREILAKADNDSLCARAMEIVDKVQTYLSRPLDKDEYARVVDSLASQQGNVTELLDKLDDNVGKVLSERKKGMFFDETVTEGDTLWNISNPDRGYIVIVHQAYDRRLNFREDVKRTINGIHVWSSKSRDFVKLPEEMSIEKGIREGAAGRL